MYIYICIHIYIYGRFPRTHGFSMPYHAWHIRSYRTKNTDGQGALRENANEDVPGRSPSINILVIPDAPWC